MQSGKSETLGSNLSGTDAMRLEVLALEGKTCQEIETVVPPDLL
jgi:hypothetical protein